jgi:hypothetical protein
LSPIGSDDEFGGHAQTPVLLVTSQEMDNITILAGKEALNNT